MATVTRSWNVREEQADEVRKLANKSDCSESAVIRVALDELLNRAPERIDFRGYKIEEHGGK